MSVLDYCKQLYLFTPHERNVINILIKEYVDISKQMFDYLKYINIDDVQFYWYKDKNEDVLGGFHNLSYDPKTKKYAIYINMFFEYDNRGDAFDIISMCLGTILHQLKHFSQLKQFGYLLYGVLQLPIIRNYTIQTSAYKISDYVDSLNISAKLIVREHIYLKAKYNISDYNLNENEKKIITIIKDKKVNIQEIRKHKQLFTYKLIELWLDK